MDKYSMRLVMVLCLFIIVGVSIAPSRDGFTPRYIRAKKNYAMRRLRRFYQPYYKRVGNYVQRLKRNIL